VAILEFTKKPAAERGAWFVAGLCTRIQGEEKLLVKHSGMAKSLKHLSDAVDPHCEHVIGGRNKGTQMVSNKFTMPSVGVMEGTAIL
jgi:hypothetical protein